MVHAMRRASALGLLVAALVVGACQPGNNGAAWGVGGTRGDASTDAVHARGGLVVGIIPDVAPVMQALTPVWNRAHPGIPVVFAAAPTVTTAVNQNTYIGEDLLISDLERVQADAVAQGTIRNLGVKFAATTLDFAVPASNPGNITRLQDTARPGLHLVNIIWSSGLTETTQAAIERMMRAPEFAAANIPCKDNYASCTYGNIVVTVSDGLAAGRLLVNPALSPIPLPAHSLPLDGAFIYHTDYLQVQREVGVGSLSAIAVPTTFAPPHAFWCAVSSYQAVNPANAMLFQSFLLTPAAQAVFRAYGYLPPSAAPNLPLEG